MDRKENQNFISTLLAAYKRLMCGSLEISEGSNLDTSFRKVDFGGQSLSAEDVGVMGPLKL